MWPCGNRRIQGFKGLPGCYHNMLMLWSQASLLAFRRSSFSMKRADPWKKNFRESSLRTFYTVGRIIRSRLVSAVVGDNGLSFISALVRQIDYTFRTAFTFSGLP